METINGVHILRAFGWEQPSQRIQDTLLNASQQPYYQLFMVQRWLNLVLDITAAGIAILIVGLAIRFRTQSTLVGLALVNIISINETLQLLILQWASMEVALGSVTRLQEFMGTATSSSEDPTDPTTVETPPPTWPAQGGIMINNLSVRYKPDSPTVLNNISLFIPAGSKVGICGRTGSGKSTFLSTLFHLTSIANGSIVIDGIDISRISPVTLRTHLIAIPQHPYLIPSASVKENLSSSSSSSSPSVSEEEIIGVLKKVRLWELVSDRGGLDSVIEIEALSAGQRQLFSCARALLQRGGPGSIVVLDEPTSNLDHGTRELVHRVIMEGFRDKTVLMILHEVEMFVDFDMVVELRDGRVGTVRT